MFEVLRPRDTADSIYHIDLAALKLKGIRGIIFDLDNTLTSWDQGQVLPELVRWFAALRQSGLNAAIVSNNKAARVEQFASALGIPGMAMAGKPRRGSFRKAMQLMGTTAADTAVVGDQVFTDILGGNRLGTHTVLVQPIGTAEFVWTRLMRRLEALVLKQLGISRTAVS
ncbi:MAG: YqeG family HAD IIIA-type phosphatase [Bacillota bacterium]